jgi:hypothetical protein
MQFLEAVTIPNTLLTILMALGVWVLISAQRSHLFNAVDMLLDENGKASSSRLALFVALSVSTFMLAYITINKSVGDTTLFYMYCAYILTWAGSKSLERALDIWMNRGGGATNMNYGGYSEYPQRVDPYRGNAPYWEQTYRNPYPQGIPQSRFAANPVFTPMDTPAKEDLAEK